jgi:hypothetical protein
MRGHTDISFSISTLKDARLFAGQLPLPMDYALSLKNVSVLKNARRTFVVRSSYVRRTFPIASRSITNMRFFSLTVTYTDASTLYFERKHFSLQWRKSKQMQFGMYYTKKCIIINTCPTVWHYLLRLCVLFLIVSRSSGFLQIS